MTSLAAELVTPEELLAMDDAVAYELVAGRLVERHVSTDASETILIVGYWLQAYIRTNPLGVFMAPDQGFQIFPDARTIRKPDIAFVREANRPRVPVGYMTVAPDLVVEVASLNDVGGEVREKADLWLSAGVRLVWVLWPGSREVHVYRPDGNHELLTSSATISGEAVLPGFECRVDDLFPVVRPTPARETER